MSIELIIIILGVVFILLAISTMMAKENSKGLLNPNLRIPYGILGIMLIIYGGYSFGTVSLQQGQIEYAEVGNKLDIVYPIEKVQVLSPVEGDYVSCRILTKGVYPESHNKDIWVVLKPSDDKYYPQSDHTNTSYKRKGEWQVITRFGGDEGEAYELIVYETDKVASAYFSNTIQEWKNMDSYPGLEVEEIPNSAQEVDRINIYLKDNCRGVF